MIPHIYSNNKNGFTLVELAIVMTIIGLLIGGVLKGQELLKNAKITTTISQVNAQNTAVATFRDLYGYFPGDFAQATRRLPGCNIANSCQNGDGNGIVGPYITSWASDASYEDGAITTENTQFWKHIALANMMSGIAGTAGTPAWGETHPQSKFNGGFRVVQTDITGHFSGRFNLISRLGSLVTGPIRRGPGQNPVTPLIGFIIDKKMDDGKANVGLVQASSASGSGACRENGSPTGLDGFYTTNIDSYDCILAFSLR